MLVLVRAAEGSLQSAGRGVGGVELDLVSITPSRGVCERCNETCDSLCIEAKPVPKCYLLETPVLISSLPDAFGPNHPPISAEEEKATAPLGRSLCTSLRSPTRRSQLVQLLS